jgi:hypothetical protein
MPLRERIIHPDEEYDADALERGGEEPVLEQVTPVPEPPVEVQGEPMGWTKGPPYPKGWREDGRYGPRDGEDERRRAGE